MEPRRYRKERLMTESWTLPAPLATAEVRMDDGALIIIRRHGNPDGPRIVLSHGNGLSADLYYPFWSLLADRFDVVIYDIRSHGRNPASDLQAQNFWTFVHDNVTILAAVDRRFGEKPNIGIYHSMSALIAILHAQQDGKFLERRDDKAGRFTALILFDPPLKLPRGTFQDMENMEYKMSSYTQKRRSRFETREEFIRMLDDKSSFARLAPGVTELFARTLLRPCADSAGFELCCPVEHEAKAWEYFSCWVEYSEIENIACPVKVISADPTERYSFIPSRKLDDIIHVDYDFVPEATHLLVLEKPEECAALTLEFLENIGL